MLSILSDGPDRKVVLPNGHRGGWLQDGDRVSGDPWGHLAGHRLDDPAGGRDGGKCNGGLLFQACGKKVREHPTSPSVFMYAAAGQPLLGKVHCGFEALTLRKKVVLKRKILLMR